MSIFSCKFTKSHKTLEFADDSLKLGIKAHVTFVMRHGSRSFESDMATHSSILAWRIPWTEEPGGLQFKRVRKLDTAE